MVVGADRERAAVDALRPGWRAIVQDAADADEEGAGAGRSCDAGRRRGSARERRCVSPAPSLRLGGRVEVTIDLLARRARTGEIARDAPAALGDAASRRRSNVLAAAVGVDADDADSSRRDDVPKSRSSILVRVSGTRISALPLASVVAAIGAAAGVAQRAAIAAAMRILRSSLGALLDAATCRGDYRDPSHHALKILGYRNLP